MAAEGARAPAAVALEVSLVIPVRNEEGSLPALISSIQAQTFPPAEVVIVDGGSDDKTVELGRRLTEGDARFRFVEAGDATPGRGRNVGTEEARSEWVAYTDAGIRVEPTWLERLVSEVVRDPTAEVVYGNYEPRDDTFFERAAALAYVAPKRELPGGAKMRPPFIASSLMRRDVWLRVGGFPDLRAAEDLIFMERIARSGIATRYAPEATVWWQLQPTLARTFRKFVLYSKHNVWAGRQRFWHYGLARLYVVALFFVVLFFVALAFSHSAWRLPLLVAGLLAAGLLARAAKSIWLHREGRTLLWALNPARLLSVAAVIVTVDFATFVGWAQALLSRPRRR